MSRFLFVSIYLLIAGAGLAGAAVEHLRGDTKNVIPLLLLAGVAVLAALIRLTRVRR